ncbi:hypothetical protein J2046_002548 [Rhizobium petrolearium]|uniref:plasmid mobilization protein n=1 Tax=Neorhizobium petrolearium TaxID=515361 RepID=UPI001AE147A3|nr:plasmid mobilization relaxosome protein MobC [Neorhizobium petrolearium]MBP1844289.1 hypothetical protein [Neorhizobium petrolearium]
MGQRRERTIYLRVTTEEHAAIAQAAAQAKLTVVDFTRSVALSGAGAQPYYTDEDRLLLLCLREELRAEGCNLTRVLIALNRDGRFAEAPFKADLLKMQRVIAALCVELSVRAKKITPQSRRD